MSPYRAVLRARALQLLQYRAAAWAGVATQLAFGLIHVEIFTAFYESAATPPPLPLAHVVGYVWLGQAFFAMLPWRLDNELVKEFVSGDVAYQLLRPVDLYAFWFWRHVAHLAAPALLRCGPVLVLAALFLGLPAPASPAALAAFLVALSGALALGAAMLTTLTVSFFWTVSGQGMAQLHAAAFFLFSGMTVPLPLMPDWMQPALALQPYRAFSDAPYRLYLGHLAPGELAGVLAHQLAWTAAFVLVGRALMASARRQLVVQGG